MPVDTITMRKLREKQRMTYKDEPEDDLDEVAPRTFSVEEKLASNAYNADFVKERVGSDVTMKLFQETGFRTPMVIKDKTGLGMRVPSSNFTVNDVKACVGSRRVIDVMDVMTQKGETMTMKDYVSYYNDKEDRDRLLNVISLEFSGTKLDNYVEQPSVVHQNDWVDTVWPTDLKEKQCETTNVLEKMFYPKVQRYCLMSVGGCYTDFHIDMGGTSVWYHILHGSKVFWLIPPTETNLRLYEDWTMSGKQGDIFFGDKVEACQRIQLQAGWTFMIPTGWIHAVYTPVDSLVFGGNFLHTFNASMQLRIWQIESRTHVPNQFRYPFFTEIHWYMLEKYVSTLLGRQHRNKDAIEDDFVSDRHEETSNDGINTPPCSPMPTSADLGYGSPMADDTKCVKQTRNFTRPQIHLTKFELEGLRDTVLWLEQLAPTKKKVPRDIPFPNSLLSDARMIIDEHSQDDPSLAMNGETTLKWTRTKPSKGKKTTTTSVATRGARKNTKRGGHGNQRGRPLCPHRRRRVRCKHCEPCTRTDCRECVFCEDMRKFGGPGILKQSCMSRKCLAPVLPNTADCFVCHERDQVDVGENGEEEDGQLMECGVCWEIHHPICFRQKYPDIASEGVVNEDLPSSWECPKCVQEGFEGQSQARIPKAVREMKKRDSESKDSITDGKSEHEEVEDHLPEDKNVESESDSEVKKGVLDNKESNLGSAVLDMQSQSSESPEILPSLASKFNTEAKINIPSTPTRVVKSQPSPNGSPSLFEKLADPAFLSPPTTVVSSVSPTKPASSPIKQREPVLETLGKCLQESSSMNKSPIVPIVKLDLSACKLPCLPAALGKQDGESSRDSSSSRSSRLGARSLGRDSATSATSDEENQVRVNRRRSARADSSESAASSVSSRVTRRSSSTLASGSCEREPRIATRRSLKMDKSSDRDPRPRVILQKLSYSSSQRRGSFGSESTDSRSSMSTISSMQSTESVRRSSRRKKEISDDSSVEMKSPPPIKDAGDSDTDEGVASADNDLDEWKAASVEEEGDICVVHREPVSERRETSIIEESKPDINDNGDSKQCKGTGGAGSSGGQQQQQQSSQSSGQSSSQGSVSYTIVPGLVGGGGGLGGGGDGEEPPHKQFKRDIPASAPNVSIVQPKQEVNVEMAKYVVRPAPVIPPPKQVGLKDGTKHPLDKHIWLYIFSFLDQTDLTRLLSVCKTWYRWSLDSSLWYKLDVSQRRPLRQHHLIGVIRRQPKYLDLSWTNISHAQLKWIVARLPHLKHVLLGGCSWSAVSALCNSSCPLLFSLDLSWVSGTRTQCLRDLLAPPTDHRPGVDDSVSRLHRCTSLSLAGSDITDASTQYLSMWLPKLSDLTLSFSCQLTDEGIRNLVSLPITNLDLSGCKGLTHAVLPVFMEMPQLQEVLLAQIPRITKPYMETFLRANPGVWEVLPPMGLKRKPLS